MKFEKSYLADFLIQSTSGLFLMAVVHSFFLAQTLPKKIIAHAIAWVSITFILELALESQS